MRERVKCLAIGSSVMALVIACAGFSGDAAAQILTGNGLGPKPPKPPAALDDTLPLGALRYAPPRPKVVAEPGACSSRAHVCVHRAVGVDETQ